MIVNGAARSAAMSVLIALLILVPFGYASVPENATNAAYSSDGTVEQQRPSGPMPSAAGDVLFRGNGTSRDVYVRLGSNESRSYELDGDDPVQGPVALDIPVNWTQRISVESTENASINLWNHNETVPSTLLSDAIEIRIERNGSVISEVPIFQVPEGSWNLTVTYTTPEVRREVTCEDRTVADLLPDGAQLITSDLPLDTFVQKVCTIRLYHESYTPYTGVSFEVTEIAREDVVSIYSVDQRRYLFARNNTVVVPQE